VKSALSKAELLDALEKIKILKGMTPGGPVTLPVAGGFSLVHARPRPFGMVFAYDLGGNSLDSLLDNIKEWEKDTPAEFWPNYICVLGVGVIDHFDSKTMQHSIDSDKITTETWPMAISFKEDSLFQFYSALHDIGSRMQLGPVELRQYYDPAVQIGRYIVSGRGFEGSLVKDGTSSTRTARLKEATIDRIVDWCSARGTMRYEEVLLKQFGAVPLGMEKLPILDLQVFLYDPDNLPDLHQLSRNIITMVGNRPSLSPSLANAATLDINGQRYIIAFSGFTEDDWEDAHVPGVSKVWAGNGR
jgi:hypothetical protein